MGDDVADVVDAAAAAAAAIATVAVVDAAAVTDDVVVMADAVAAATGVGSPIYMHENTLVNMVLVAALTVSVSTPVYEYILHLASNPFLPHSTSSFNIHSVSRYAI